jgi:hypothetical protein
MRRRTLLAARAATARWRPLPDFLIVGAQKAGTTSLYDYLCDHPQVCRAFTKEVDYFSLNAERGEAWYRAHFPTQARRASVARNSGGPSVTGEASPDYLLHPRAAARARNTLGDVRLIALLRDPVTRAVSSYHHSVRWGFEKRPIEEALSCEAAPSPPAVDFGQLRRFGYLERGHYAEQLERWLRHFDRSRLLVVATEELTRTGGSGYDRVLRFLDLPAWRPVHFAEALAYSYQPPPPAVVDRLARYYAPHNARLWELLGTRWEWISPQA